MNESIIDYIIIGGGIAGLYANFLLSKNKNGILLEKNDVFGGRILQKIFHNYNIKLGSGILEDNDLNFIKLIKKLKIKLNSFDGGIIKSFLPEQMDMHKATKRIKKISNPIKNIIVLGEIVSKKHGNVEGSIESVNRILKK